MADEKIFIADKATLDAVKSDVAGVKTDVAGVKTDVAGINSKVGATNDTGGSATAGTLFGKINAIISHLLTYWTSSRAASLDKIATIDTRVSNLASTPQGGVGERKKVITANTSFTIPAGVSAMRIIAYAAGNDGANGNANSPGTGGAGGEGYEGMLKVTPGASMAITVGTGNTVIAVGGTNVLTLAKGGGAASGQASAHATGGGSNYGGGGG